MKWLGCEKRQIGSETLTWCQKPLDSGSDLLSPLWAEGNRHPSEAKQINQARTGAFKSLFFFLQGKRKLGLSDLNQASLFILSMELNAGVCYRGQAFFKGWQSRTVMP